jgi:hypothetical protein
MRPAGETSEMVRNHRGARMEKPDSQTHRGLHGETGRRCGCAACRSLSGPTSGRKKLTVDNTSAK